MKKYLIIAGLVFGGYKILQKKQQMTAIKDLLQIRPQNIRNIKFVSNGVNLTIDVNLINHSDMDFTMNSLGAITLKKIYFHSVDGKVIATAYPNITNIAIQPNSNTILRNVETFVNVGSVFSNFNQIFSDALLTTAEIEIFGKTYSI